MLLIYSISVIIGFGAISISLSLYINYRKKVIINYLLFIFSIWLMLLGNLVYQYCNIVKFDSESSIFFISGIISSMGAALAICNNPTMIHRILGLTISNWKRNILQFVSISAVIGIITNHILMLNNIEIKLLTITLMVLLNSSFAYLFLFSFLNIRKLGNKQLRKAIIIIAIISAIFFPFMLPYRELSTFFVACYFIILNSFSIIFAFSILNQPAYYENGITEYCLKKFGITDREKDVIELILGGSSINSISDALFISTKTVQNHTTSIYRKCEVKNRVQLVNLIKTNQK